MSKDISSRQKINKETLTLDDTLNQMDFVDIYRKQKNTHSFKVHMKPSQYKSHGRPQNKSH